MSWVVITAGGRERGTVHSPLPCCPTEVHRERSHLSHLRSSQKFKASAAYFHHLTGPLTPHFLPSPILEPSMTNKLPHVHVALPFPLPLALRKPGIPLRSTSPRQFKSPFSLTPHTSQGWGWVSILLAPIALFV